MINSTANEKYKYIKSLLKKKSRTQHRRYTVEGIKSVRDALKMGKVCEIAVSESFYNNEVFDYKDTKVNIIKDEIFPALCDTQTPQGIIGIAVIGKKEQSYNTDKVYIYCDCVTDPGNAGTIIRTADASGCGGVIFSKGCVDIYSPKTVRASMGSFFSIDIVSGAEKEILSEMKKRGFSVICGALNDNTVNYTSVDMTKPTVIVIGNEANGVSDEVMSICDKCVKIPIYGSAESLNAGVAAAVIMYEAARQRDNK